MTNKVMSATPATNVLTNVYELYMVLNQWALRLISQSQGTVEATVKANQTIYSAAQMVFFQIYFLPSATVSGRASSSRLRLRILYPSTVHKPMVSVVQMIKNVGFKNPFLPSRMGSLATTALSSHS